MLKVVVAEGSFCILRSAGSVTYVEGIAPQIHIDGLAPQNTSLGECLVEPGIDHIGEYTDYTSSAITNDGSYTLTFFFRCYKSAVVCKVSIKTQSKWHSPDEMTLSSSKGIRIGLPRLPGLTGAMGNYLHKEWWSRPWFGSEESDLIHLPAKTQSLVWLTEGQDYCALFPLCQGIAKAELMGSEDGLVLSIGGYGASISELETTAFVLAVGTDAYEVADTAATIGLASIRAQGLPRFFRRYPNCFEYLGWCTWDAFYQEVDEASVISKAEEFQKLKLPVKWFIIDDGWSDADRKTSRLNGFGADKSKFPNGLSELTRRLKSDYRLKWVGVWHAMTGYWNGINPDSRLALEWTSCLVKTGSGRLLPAPDKQKAFAFWDAWHSKLKAQGIDFLKVDFQSHIRRYWTNNKPLTEVASESHAALEASVGLHFDNALINCMGMATENFWSRPISAITRFSDDYFPKEQDSVSEHVLQNVYNSYYHSPLYWGDWDMWWTGPEQGTCHAVLRAISGGPIYISDKLGETSPDKLWPLMLSDGKILRCDRPGLPTLDCLVTDVGRLGKPVKVWNRCGRIGYVAAFNVDTQGTGNDVNGQVSPADVPYWNTDCETIFVIREHFTGHCTVCRLNDVVRIRLPVGGVSLYSIVPYDSGFACYGLITKYIGAGTVEYSKVFDKKAVVVLKEGGAMGFTCSREVCRITVNGNEIGFDICCGLHKVYIPDSTTPVWVEIEFL